MRPETRRGAGLLLAALVMLAVGCDSAGDRRPDTARVVMEGPAGARVRLVTSTAFDVLQQVPTGPAIGVTLLDADTAEVALPFEQSFDIRNGARFYALATRVDGGDGQLRMRGYIDGDLRYNASNPDTLRFLYFFQGFDF